MEILRSAVRESYLVECEVEKHDPYWGEKPLPEDGVYQAISKLSDKIQELEQDSIDISSLANAVNILKEAHITESEKKNIHVQKDYGCIHRSMPHIEDTVMCSLRFIGLSIVLFTISLYPAYFSWVFYHWAFTIYSTHNHFHILMVIPLTAEAISLWAEMKVLKPAIYYLAAPAILVTDVALRKLGILSSEEILIEKSLEAKKAQLLAKADKLIEQSQSSLTKDEEGLWSAELQSLSAEQSRLNFAPWKKFCLNNSDSHSEGTELQLIPSLFN